MSTDDLLISDLHPEDVVLGRGAGPNEHCGNIAFREIVNKYKPEYIGTVNRKSKSHIACKVIRAVKARQGRFLKRAPGRQDDVYVMAEESIVIEKAKQALRHGRCTVNPRKGRISNSDSFSSFSSVSSNGAVATNIFARRNASLVAPIAPLVSPVASLTGFKTLPKPTSTSVCVASSQSQPAVSSPGNPAIDALFESMDESSYQTCLQLLMALAESKRSDSANCLKICTLIETLIAFKRNVKEQQWQRDHQEQLNLQLALILISKLPNGAVAYEANNFSQDTSPLSSPPSSPSVTGLCGNILDSSKPAPFMLTPKAA
jgi:hypothetical protein